MTGASRIYRKRLCPGAIQTLEAFNRLWRSARSHPHGKLCFPSSIGRWTGRPRKRALNSTILPQKSGRRSQRILLNVGIIVEGLLQNGKPFSERSTTLIVNAHGALIRLHAPVLAGQPVSLTNVKSGEKCGCKVVGVTSGQNGEPAVGIEFAEPYPRFWRVAFPPEDWSPRSAEAKRIEKHTVPPAPARKPQ